MLSFSTVYFAFTRETTHIVLFVRDSDLLELRQLVVCIQRAAHSGRPMVKPVSSSQSPDSLT